PTPPQPGSYPGWPELPKMEERPGDYYYATHICPAFTTASGVSETNLRSYTVCYSHEMMSGMWSAYPIHASYKGSSGRNDSFAYDPDISSSLQPVITQSAGSYKPQPGYSRGHLLASDDRTATVDMNKQTFYVTNMAPQWQNGFNSGVWSTLETNTWNNVCADTLFVVSGVHYANTNTTVMDNATPQNTIYVPTNFYKVMIRSKAGNTGKPLYELSADELQCIAFWFENKSYPNSSMSTFRTTVADVEQKTGMTFFPNVPNAPKDSSAGSWSF
ncbi:MAG: DNA/RNA non-specific endonuclease, partial [Alistipes sp.]|nr:DNA/RNA non-specific endonuclease [Alistipes sp.]